MRRGALKKDDLADRIAHRYWTYSLWLVAGVTLLALLAHNIVLFRLDVMHVFISVLFALFSSVALLSVLKSVLSSAHPAQHTAKGAERMAGGRSHSHCGICLAQPSWREGIVAFCRCPFCIFHPAGCARHTLRGEIAENH